MIDTQVILNRKSIVGAEERIKSYKELLTEGFKLNIYPDWFKDFLRYMKNFEEKRLKKLVEENENLKAGLNPPAFYPNYKLKTINYG